MLAILILAAGLARGAVLPPGDLAFGLDRLHWGMTLPEAKSRYPLLQGAPMGMDQLSTSLTLPDYAIAGCRFTVTLDFERGFLGQVQLDSEGTAHLKACNDQIKAMLARQYGGEAGGFSTASNPHGYSEYASWGGPVTEVMYGALTDGFITIRFSHAGVAR
jgi:hypothetical protein